jgi:hypothetical protein
MERTIAEAEEMFFTSELGIQGDVADLLALDETNLFTGSQVAVAIKRVLELKD